VPMRETSMRSPTERRNSERKKISLRLGIKRKDWNRVEEDNLRTQRGVSSEGEKKKGTLQLERESRGSRRERRSLSFSAQENGLKLLRKRRTLTPEKKPDARDLHGVRRKDPNFCGGPILSLQEPYLLSREEGHDLEATGRNLQGRKHPHGRPALLVPDPLGGPLTVQHCERGRSVRDRKDRLPVGCSTPRKMGVMILTNTQRRIKDRTNQRRGLSRRGNAPGFRTK